MKRLVCLLMCLLMLLTTVAFAEAPTVQHYLDVDRDVESNETTPIFSIQHNGSDYDWRIDRIVDGVVAPATTTNLSGIAVGESNVNGNAEVEWDYWYNGDYTAYDGGVNHRLTVSVGDTVTSVVDFYVNYFYNYSFDRVSLLSWYEDPETGELVEITNPEDIPNSGIVVTKDYMHNNIRSFGPRFTDVDAELTDKWYRFTALDLSQDGTQAYYLISGDYCIVGEVHVTVNGDSVKVSYKYYNENIWDWKNYKFFTFFKDFDSVTTVEPNEIENKFEYDVEYSIANDLGGDTSVLLYMCNKATHAPNENGFWAFREEYAPFVQIINAMLEMIGKSAK